MVVEPQILKKIPAWELQLRVGNKGANITKPHNEEGNSLNVKVHEVVISSKGNIIAATEEEESSNSKLQQMESVHI